MIPRKGEARDAFVSRCMKDDGMRSEYPDDDQRLAVCGRYFESNREEFTEAVTLNVSSLDAEGKVLNDVAVLGASSLNGRTYTDGARRDAARLLEGAKVFMNHRVQVDGRHLNHSVNAYVGRLSGPYVDDRGMVRARKLRVVNEEHWPLLSSLARNDPTAAGLSIDAVGDVNQRTGEVRSIGSIRSVDIVSEPATTHGIFEERTTEMDWKDITIDDLRKERPDLLKALDDEIAALKGKVAELEKKSETTKETTKEEMDERRAARLRAAVAKGARMTESQLVAYESIEDDKTAEKFLAELPTVARSSPKGGGGKGGELTTAALREAAMA